MTQAVLAETANVNETHIGNIENERNSPSLEIINRIALALSVPASRLFEDNGDSSKFQDSLYEVNSTPTHLDRLNLLLPFIREYQNLANEFSISDIFQDNGGKLLQVLIITRLKNLADREGNDAEDEFGNQYELKTVNLNLTSSFSTHHHINPSIIAKYRKVNWIFCLYEGIEIVEIYQARPKDLEPYFTLWENKWNASADANGIGKDINNPKIPVKFVKSVGRLLYKDIRNGVISLGEILSHWSDDSL